MLSPGKLTLSRGHKLTIINTKRYIFSAAFAALTALAAPTAVSAAAHNQCGEVTITKMSWDSGAIVTARPLYTSDAADDRTHVELAGLRVISQKI